MSQIVCLEVVEPLHRIVFSMPNLKGMLFSLWIGAIDRSFADDIRTSTFFAANSPAGINGVSSLLSVPEPSGFPSPFSSMSEVQGGNYAITVSGPLGTQFGTQRGNPLFGTPLFPNTRGSLVPSIGQYIDIYTVIIDPLTTTPQSALGSRFKVPPQTVRPITMFPGWPSE